MVELASFEVGSRVSSFTCIQYMAMTTTMTSTIMMINDGNDNDDIVNGDHDNDNVVRIPMMRMTAI